ncbi:hypothetical protein [Lewinella sp. JB7]|uniref:hypothetical protein n=1 Tax=Lewinella sp. JB7 TaxID=2962887 RepID=UPI0020C9BAA8|nr:hypothetical protein [Lewinella sp. JB7]MCP9236452.1 hypothetical protein [Lewinella sp. JB7]
MRFIFTLALTGLSLFMAAQTCTINNASADFCTTCSSGTNPALVNGVFTGTLRINTTYTISASCLATVTFANNVAIDIDKRNDLYFAADPYVQEGTTTTVTGHHVHGGLINAFGTNFTYSGPNTYDDLAAIMSPPAGSGGVGGVGGGGSSQLPVTLLSWDAIPTPAGIALSWSTASETDNDYYTVEHSIDGLTFSKLAIVPGSTNTSSVQDYTYHHLSPTAGFNYYRLCQHDIDGTINRFGVISAVAASTESRQTLSPNPAHPGQEIVVRGLDVQERSPVTLHHIDGRIIGSYPTAPDQSTRIQLPASVANGVYVIRHGRSSQLLVVR